MMTLNRNQAFMLALAGAAATAAYVMVRGQVRAREEHRDHDLDTALADTFPASDPLPVSAAQPARNDDAGNARVR